MSDPFHIAARALRSGRRICVDCGTRYQLTHDATGEIECCDSCRARRSRLIERLSDKFHLVPKEIVPKARQETGALQKCSDCGKEFQPSVRGLPLDACCEECHGRRVSMVDHLAEQSFRGWHPKGRSTRWFHSARVWLFATVAIALASGAWLGAKPALRYYHEWREKRHFARAEKYFAAGDFKHATLDARNALAFNANNSEAIRLIAKSHEALHTTQALEWRARLGALLPNDLENSLGWTAAAIHTGDYATADRLLRGIPYSDHDTALFHHLSALVALQKRDAIKAEFHWSEAAKLNAKDDTYKLNMATVRLKLGSAIERTNGLELLNQLRIKSSERLPAMRALLSDSLRHGENAVARDLAVAIANEPKAPFSDKLLRLSTLRTLHDPDFGIWRGRLEAEAPERPDYAYELIIWMNRNGYAKDVPALLPKLRADFVSRPPVAIAVADSYAVTQNWPELQKALKGSKWFHMDYVRLATLAWAMDRSDERAAAATTWKAAMTAAEGRLDRLETLARAAITWGWDARAEEALWSITSLNVQSPTWVLQTLWTRSLKRGDTDRLRNVARLMQQANPRSVSARNNYIFLSLLKRTEEGSPHQAAETLYKENPVNPSVISTYALSLFLLGRPRAATDIMELLPATQLREPSIAIYYGMFLAAAKRTAKSEEYLQLGEHWPLLPEEEAILDRVMQKSPVQPGITPSVPVQKAPANSQPSSPRSP